MAMNIANNIVKGTIHAVIKLKIYENITFPGKFLDEISEFKTIYCLVSGGYHSTSAALLLYDYGFKNVSLVHNRTYLEMKHVLKLIQDLILRTDYSYNLVEPSLKGERVGSIFKASLMQVDKIAEYMREGKGNYRDLIPCCKRLKKQPARKWYTKNIHKESSVIISSLCPHESRNRNHWLKQLRELDTFIRVHGKMGGDYYAYPFRDVYSDRPFHQYLISKDIMPEHSGCVLCPIQLAYMIVKG